jgi:hypothetical protein
MTGLSTLLKAGLKEVGKKTAKKNVSITKEVLPKVLDDVLESKQSIESAFKEPTNTIKAFKLFKQNQKTGELFPLFVKMKGNKSLPLDKWIQAEAGELSKSGKVKSSIGDLAYRPGFHSGDLPIATHIGGKVNPLTGKRISDRKVQPNIREKNQVWAEVELPADKDWQSIANSRARIKQDGNPDVKTAHITDEVPYGGSYRYKTNPNMTGNWLISGEMKINRILSNDEVKAINNKAGVSDLPRVEEFLQKKKQGGMVMRNDNYNTQRAI